jgi:hypothetical protein
MATVHYILHPEPWIASNVGLVLDPFYLVGPVSVNVASIFFTELAVYLLVLIGGDFASLAESSFSVGPTPVLKGNDEVRSLQADPQREC